MKLAAVAGAFISGDKDRLSDLALERAPFITLTAEPQFQQLKMEATEAYHAVTEEAFRHPERLTYAQGFRDGLWLLFQMVDSRVDDYKQASSAIAELQAEETEEAESIVLGDSAI